MKTVWVEMVRIHQFVDSPLHRIFTILDDFVNFASVVGRKTKVKSWSIVEEKVYFVIVVIVIVTVLLVNHSRQAAVFFCDGGQFLFNRKEPALTVLIEGAGACFTIKEMGCVCAFCHVAQGFTLCSERDGRTTCI